MEKHILSILGYSQPRAGSTYVFHTLSQIIQNRWFIEQMMFNDMGVNSDPWTCKIHDAHLQHPNISKAFREFSIRKDVCSIYLYRDDKEDRILSHLLAQASNRYYSQSTDIALEPFTWDKDNDPIQRFIGDDIRDMAIRDTYHFDKTIRYEDLTGDWRTDFADWIDPSKDYNYMPQLYRKIASKQDKIAVMTNYDAFKKEFDRWYTE